MAPSHADAAASVAGRVRRAIGWWWRAIAGNPVGVAVAFVAWLAGFLGSMFVLQSFVWDALVADFPRKMPESVADETRLIAVTPFDAILVQVEASAVVGLLVAAPAVAYFARGWLGQRRDSSAGPLAVDTVLQAVLAVLVVIALAVVAAYEYVVPWLFAVGASESVGALRVWYAVTRWLEAVLLVGLALGLSAVAPFGAAALSRADVVRPTTVVADATRVGLGLAAFGLVFWPVTPLAQALWFVPLLASLALCVVVCRVAGSGKGSRPVP